jgi:hypothetical protein
VSEPTSLVSRNYLHSIPTAGNDLVLAGARASVEIALGLASGFATHIRPGSDDLALARVG